VDDELSAAERRSRLAGDAELVEELRRDGFAGPQWDYFANELARYGLAVIRAWIRKGDIDGKCAEKGFHTTPLPPEMCSDEVAVGSIADETVAEALVAFRDDILARGVWDPDKGASLRTFFIGQCLLQYRNAASRWLRQQHDETPIDPHDQVLRTAIPGRAIPDVEDDVVRSMTVELILRGAVNERAARALALDACGYSRAEIAADLGTTEVAVAAILKQQEIRLERGVPTFRRVAVWAHSHGCQTI
jgi:hypothetical protein